MSNRFLTHFFLFYNIAYSMTMTLFVSAKRGGVPEDKSNFISLIQDLQHVFSKKKLLLTAAIGASPETIDTAYDVEKM